MAERSQRVATCNANGLPKHLMGVLDKPKSEEWDVICIQGPHLYDWQKAATKAAPNDRGYRVFVGEEKPPPEGHLQGGGGHLLEAAGKEGGLRSRGLRMLMVKVYRLGGGDFCISHVYAHAGDQQGKNRLVEQALWEHLRASHDFMLIGGFNLLTGEGGGRRWLSQREELDIQCETLPQATRPGGRGRRDRGLVRKNLYVCQRQGSRWGPADSDWVIYLCDA